MVIFGRVRYLLEEVILFHLPEHTIILKNHVSFLFTLLITRFCCKSNFIVLWCIYFLRFTANQSRLHKLELGYNKAELHLLKSKSNLILFIP
jgi:hypothetical protein